MTTTSERPAVRSARAAAAPTRAAGLRGVDLAVSAACLLGALALALYPLLDVYGGTAAVPAVVGGLVLGGGAAVLAAVRRWSAVALGAVLVVVYFLAGGALAAPTTTVAGIVPTMATLRTLAAGVATSWQQVLTLQPPIGASGGLLVAPFLLALVGSVLAIGIALRARSSSVAASAAVVPVLVAAVVALLGVRFPSVRPVVTGTVLLVVLLPWAAWRAGSLRARRVVALGLVAAVTVAAALLGGPAVVGGQERLVVRDEIVPPFDPRAYSSPLAAFRQFVKQEKDTTLFTVTGLPSGARIRLATMDRYDGVVWNVAGDGTAQGSGEFRRVGGQIPTDDTGATAKVGIDVQKLSGVWLPTVGSATSIDLHDASSAEGLRYDEATGAAVVTGGLHGGLRYDLDVVVPRVPSVREIGRAPAKDVSLPQDSGVPDVVGTTAADVARDAGTPAQVAQALAEWLAQNGYFSHGITESGQAPSLSGHGANRMVSLLDGDLMVGDGEQYASAMALMAREMGLPARVVLGFVPQATAKDGAPVPVTGDDVQAWVEIDFAGYGWVPFDPTPPREQTPQKDDKPNPSDPKPQVVQPPPPAPDAVKPPDDDTEQPQPQAPPATDSGSQVWRTVAIVAGTAAVPLLLLASPFIVMGAIKARRRRRRRRGADGAQRVAGGWDEMLDAAVDLRHPVPGGATRLESARALGDAGVAAPVVALARGADRAVFAADVPSDEEAAAYWADVDSAVRDMRRGVGWWRRTRARLSLASLRRGTGRSGRRGSRRASAGARTGGRR
ncbi:transglutaminase family protein [Cellulomonas sp. HZM]|uniref:transglutaminase-like domain-containing protein n=1 Tax=Cellulomonas sp. HZM TaxID=1454010 RepID=UPI00068D61DB|nr:transglutaminase-like domain-containing protein [Cellulomonas sp. HZM]